VPGEQARPRVSSVDALRGFVMIVMALDHVREYFHAGAQQFPPEDLTRTTAILFLTRWVTHICAPVFVFTAGLGAFFWMSRGRTAADLASFLWKRGLWLVVLELTVLRLAMNFSLTSGFVVLTVLWVIGWSMIALGFLARLPVRVLAALSIATIALHNLADPVTAGQFGGAAWLWNILHQQGMFLVGGVPVVTAYPLIPWIAVMSAGFCFGKVMMLAPQDRRTWMIRIGLGLTAAFFAIRGLNIYGDPLRWSTAIPGMTVLSFLRCTKYPPSLDFLLMTLGPALLLLAWFERMRLSKANPLIVFGRVPLFYFLLHLFLIHALTIPFALARYGHAGFLFRAFPGMGGPAELFPSGYGYGLGVVYVVWISVVAALYPVCLWFARVKDRRRDGWLTYL
jgi:uncharacterized membrane protein